MCPAPVVDAGTEKRSATWRPRLCPKPQPKQVAARVDRESSLPVRSPTLPSLPFPLTHDVARGLLSYVHSLIDQKDWVMVPIVCKVQYTLDASLTLCAYVTVLSWWDPVFSNVDSYKVLG